MSTKFEVKFNQSDQLLKVGFDNVQYVETGEQGTSDYEKLTNKPKIESVELIGNKTFEDLGLEAITNQEILDIAKKILGGGN